MSALERTVSGYTSCNETSRGYPLEARQGALRAAACLTVHGKEESFPSHLVFRIQTGKLVGKLPVSTKRVVGLFAAIAALLIAISVTALLAFGTLGRAEI